MSMHYKYKRLIQSELIYIKWRNRKMGNDREKVEKKEENRATDSNNKKLAKR